MKRIFCDVDNKIHAAFKTKAASKGESITSALMKLIEKFLKEK
jgi:hypothetical protein